MRRFLFIFPVLLLPYALFSLRWPTDDRPITCTFGEIHGGNHFHKGIDIGVAKVAVYAVAKGKIKELDRVGEKDYGKYIKIDHGNGKYTLYAHLDKIEKDLKVGDEVTEGQKIGISGNTGSSSGYHLHFEMRRVVPTGRGSTVLYYVNPLKNHTYDWYLGSPEDEAAPVIGSHGNENKTFKSFLLYQGEGGRDEEGNINSFIGSADSTTIERSILG